MPVRQQSQSGESTHISEAPLGPGPHHEAEAVNPEASLSQEVNSGRGALKRSWLGLILHIIAFTKDWKCEPLDFENQESL